MITDEQMASVTRHIAEVMGPHVVFVFAAIDPEGNAFRPASNISVDDMAYVFAEAAKSIQKSGLGEPTRVSIGT